MLPAKEHVYECYDGHDGILRYVPLQVYSQPDTVICDRSVRAKSLFIDSSTIDQNTVTDISTKTAQCGGHYLDAPVSGGTACTAPLG